MIFLDFILQAIKIIVLLGILVIIHEMGHFLVAKYFKMPIKEFAIGFGKKIWSTKKGETEYSLRIFPLGGFVDLDDDSREGAFAKTPLYRKNLVLVAGTFVNLVFALILAFIVLALQGNFISNKIEYVKEDTNASKVGIVAGDEVYKINGKKIISKRQVDTIMYNNQGEIVEIEVIRNGEKITYEVAPYKEEYVSTGFSVDENNTIVAIQKDLNDKLQLGDKITKINEIEVIDSTQLVNEAKKYIDEAVVVEVLRDNIPINVTIDIGKYEQHYIGIGFAKAEDTIANRMYYAVVLTGDFLSETLKGLGQLVTGKTQNAELMGIVGVSDMITKTSSVLEYLAIMASVSLSLAIVNLLPLPLLDGGKIVMYTIERYRKKEFSIAFVNITSLITLALLIMLTIYVTIKDIIRIV